MTLFVLCSPAQRERRLGPHKDGEKKPSVRSAEWGGLDHAGGVTRGILTTQGA